MKTIYKILIICIVIFLIGIVATKISIDNTFEKIECDKIANENISIALLQQIKIV